MKRLVFLILVLWASASFADNPALSQRVFGPDGNVKVGTLCSAQTSTSTGCTGVVGGVTDELVADLRGYRSVAFYSNQSSSTSYTCDIYTSDNGYDGDSGVGQDRSSTSISEAQEMIVLDGALGFVWVECSSIANNSVTVTFVAVK